MDHHLALMNSHAEGVSYKEMRTFLVVFFVCFLFLSDPDQEFSNYGSQTPGASGTLSRCLQGQNYTIYAKLFVFFAVLTFVWMVSKTVT